jgi:prepilin-type N-terminal cleavage/methylation domain-containing protein
MAERDRGFTIIELLVSLVILSMLTLMIITGLGSGRRVWERMDQNALALETVEGAQTLLRDRIERTYGATRYDTAAPYADFRGLSNRLNFLAPPPEVARPQALRRYDLSLGAAGDLILSSWSDVAADPDHPAITSVVVLRGVQAMDIAYFGVAPPDNTPRWRPAWIEQPAPPRLVRVRLAFASGDHREWPDMIVKPAADVDIRCILDIATGRCGGRG